ncbi:MAG TPA: proline dehydrogenase family protein [Egibacteraceae bacterium]|nr:proline dehydrogenase family protein [Egibacteraceae bacterium]
MPIAPGAVLRSLLIRASQSRLLREQVAQRSLPRRVALRYVAGETIDDGLHAAARLAAAGRSATLDYLGESVTEESRARSASKVLLEVLDRIRVEGLPGGVSVKPTGVGLAVDRALCEELLGEVAAAAEAVPAHVTLDMEDSSVTEATVALVERLRAAGRHEVGCAVQAYLHRTRGDIERLTAAGASLRLCKGAYAEPASVAHQSRSAVDRSFAECADWLLEHGVYPRLATHDHRLIERAKRVATALGRAPDEFEFQMLYGVRPKLQGSLVADGYRLRVYVPFGSEWYPYLVRRIAERPANLVFFLRALGRR